MTSILISHKLNEVSYVADRITVIRDGQVITTMDKHEKACNENEIIKAMVGRSIEDRFPKRNTTIGEVSLEVEHWNVYNPLNPDKKICDDINIKLHKGEVVGISGLMGAGRTEFAMSLFGKSYGQDISGTIRINGKEVHLNTVQQAIDNKIAYVTEDRKTNG